MFRSQDSRQTSTLNGKITKTWIFILRRSGHFLVISAMALSPSDLRLDRNGGLAHTTALPLPQKPAQGDTTRLRKFTEADQDRQTSRRWTVTEERTETRGTVSSERSIYWELQAALHKTTKGAGFGSARGLPARKTEENFT